MKTMIKSTTSLILLLIFVIACATAIILLFAAGWLHTYRVFTQETPVAKIILSPLQQDENGSFFTATIQEVGNPSPLTAVFNPEEVSNGSLQKAQTFTFYGDQFDIGGPTIKFKDFLTLLNFETVYKLAFIRAEYADLSIEESRTDDMTRRIDINGGYADWRSVQEDFQDETLRGSIFKLFIDDMPQISSQGVFITDQEQTLTLCVTEEGFLFCNQ